MFKAKKISFLRAFICLGFLMFLFPSISYAETHVYANDAQKNWVWNEAGSPYILEEPIYIPRESSLKIHSGVKVISPSAQEDTYSLTFDGDFEVYGTSEKPVVFTNLYSLYFSNSSSSIRNAVFDKTGLDFIRSTSTLDSVIIKNSFNAITAKGSHIKIADSVINSNSYGISSYFDMPIFQARNSVTTESLETRENTISINNSSITNNGNFDVLNETENTIDAINNWWGRAEGPYMDKISGLVNFSSWKVKDPNSIESIECCSNVLFIPGIEASRLYKDTKNFLGSSTNMLWEPNRNDDVRKMFMNSNGVSVDGSIYPKDIIDKVFGIKNIYSGFIDSMNSLVGNKTIHEWLPFAYDWRNGVYDGVNQDILNKVYSLASSSKTQKIVIVAHSNGGLFAKVLMKALETVGRSDLVEHIVFVSVPELGTPQALLAMLHGYNQGIVGGLVLSEKTARTFSQNMPGAYGLLPSRKFFDKNPLMVISDLYSTNSEIFSFEGMKNFLLRNSFSKASSKDINVPLILNPSLFSLNDSLHTKIDTWKVPSTTKTLSLVGWGLPTTKGITYEKDIHCDRYTRNVGNNINNQKKCDVSFSPVLTTSGDGTVITKSVSGNSDSTLFFNLKKSQQDTKKNINHANILESFGILSKIKDIIMHKKTEEATVNSYQKYFSEKEPVDTDTYLTVKIYSPVDIDIYDSSGQHTGLIEKPIPGKDLERYETTIPGSYYGDFGRIKMIRVPYRSDYQIILTGNDSGVFSATAEVSESDRIIASTTFSELPVTPLMNIDFIVPPTLESFASSTFMKTDMDGDGVIDFISRPDISLISTTSTSTESITDIRTYIESIRQVILSLKLPAKEEKRWIGRIDQIAKALDKKNYRKAEKVIKKITNKRFKNRKLTEVQKSEILKVFEDLVSVLEERIKRY